MAYRETNWAAIVAQADPNHARDSRIVPEYRFPAPPRGQDPRTHADGMRVFTGDYQTRGPYAPDD